MKYIQVFLLTLSVLFFSCHKRKYTNQEVDNPVYKPNTLFQSSEDLSSPKFQHLITKYQLDTIFHGETDELKRVLLLRNWIRTVVEVENNGSPYPGGGYAEGILDAALEGQGFHCGHFMKVQNGILNAYGYVSRTLGSGPGEKDGSDWHHGINEVWLNDYNKWFLSDTKYDHHYEKDNIPLSALEIRDEYLKNKGADIVLVEGPDRIPAEVFDEIGDRPERFPNTYAWIEWHLYNDMFSIWPDHKSELVMYQDDYFSNNTWIWDGKLHWAYDTEYLIIEQNRDAIEWTPNTIASEVKIVGGKALISLTSDTPNLKYYQMKASDKKEWVVVGDSVEVLLIEPKYEILFRAMNLVGVTGPGHRVIIDSK